MIKKLYKLNKLKRMLSLGFILGLLLTISPLQFFAAEKDENHQIMVSLGDSYSSGEGIEPFYGQEDDVSKKVQNPDWLAHRSKNCWPGMLTLPNNNRTMSKNRDDYWFFEAASGAVTDNMLNTFRKEYKKGKYSSVYDLDPQLDVFNEIGANEVDYVTLTLGGNDAGFADIITTCVTGSRYLNIGGLADKLNNTWDNFEKEGGIRDNLNEAYSNIAQKAGSQAQILVAGYPKLLSEDGGFLISKSEAVLVNENVSKFNNAIENIVQDCSESGIKISFVSVEEAFKNHGAYSDDPYINEVMLLARSEDLKDLQISSAYSIHPNYYGACAYAESVQAKIDELEAAKDIDEEVDISTNPEATDDEIDAKAKHFSGIVVQPEDVVLKMFDALQDGDYELAAECLDPATEQQLDFWGGITSTIVGLFTGEYMSWGQFVLEAAGATDVDVIECYSENMVLESNIDLFADILPRIPGLRNLVCTEADVYVKYRYKYNDEYYIDEDIYHVRRYEWSGWRIEEGY